MQLHEAEASLKKIANEGEAAPPLTKEEAQCLVEHLRWLRDDRESLLRALPDDDD